MEEGFLTELLSAHLSNIDRAKFKIALGLEKESSKTETYRFNVNNLTPDEDLVKEEMGRYFGDVEIVNY